MKKWIATGLVVAVAANLWAQAPEMFRYQGRLASGATLVNATLPMSFKLYNAPSGGTKLYEDSNSVAVVNGLYSTYVGDNTVFGSLTNAMTNAAVYLELTINGETFAPRERLVSVPYALNAGGNKTPAGTVVLSETYPNPELEAQGYSAYTQGVSQADWQEVSSDSWWPFSHPMPNCVGHSNQLWGFYNEDGQPSVFITVDGKRWDKYSTPFSTPDFIYRWSGFQALSLNEKLFIFEKVSGRNAYASSNGQVWSVWSNAVDSSIGIEKFVSFKESLWLFGVTNSESGSVSIVMNSTDGQNWTSISSGPWAQLDPKVGVLTSEDEMWVFASTSGGAGKMVWHSTDGINWTQSATNLPADDIVAAFFSSKLWCFSSNDNKSWSSSDNGDNWIRTPFEQPGGLKRDNPTVYNNKLWLPCGGGGRIAQILVSTNGINWITSLNLDDRPDPTMIINAGYLWVPSTYDGLFQFGAPRQIGGLYYYRRD